MRIDGPNEIKWRFFNDFSWEKAKYSLTPAHYIFFVWNSIKVSYSLVFLVDRHELLDLE